MFIQNNGSRSVHYAKTHWNGTNMMDMKQAHCRFTLQTVNNICITWSHWVTKMQCYVCGISRCHNNPINYIFLFFLLPEFCLTGKCLFLPPRTSLFSGTVLEFVQFMLSFLYFLDDFFTVIIDFSLPDDRRYTETLLPDFFTVVACLGWKTSETAEQLQISNTNSSIMG